MRRRRGANALEFALVMPVLLALLTGIMDYAWVFHLRNAAMYAARAGARTGAVTPRDRQPDGAAADSALAAWERFGLPAEPSIVAFRSGTPELATVRITIDVTDTIGFVVGPTRVQVTAVELVEEQP